MRITKIRNESRRKRVRSASSSESDINEIPRINKPLDSSFRSGESGSAVVDHLASEVDNSMSKRHPIQRIKKHTRQAEGVVGPPVVDLDPTTIPETDVLPYLANIELLPGGVGRPPESVIEFEAGDKAALELRRDHPEFGKDSADCLDNLLSPASALLDAANRGILNAHAASRKVAATLPELLDLFRKIRGHDRIRGFGQWAASKVVSARKLITGNAEAAHQILDYMNELREINLRIPELGVGEKIDISEKDIPSPGKQTADLTLDHGRQIEVKTVRDPIVLESSPVLKQLSEAVNKFHQANMGHGPYEAVIFCAYGDPISETVGKGQAKGTRTRNVNHASGEFFQDFNPDPGSTRPMSHEVRGNLDNEVLHWLNNSKVPGTESTDYVRIRIENSTSGPFQYRRNGDKWNKI